MIPVPATWEKVTAGQTAQLQQVWPMNKLLFCNFLFLWKGKWFVWVYHICWFHPVIKKCARSSPFLILGHMP